MTYQIDKTNAFGAIISRTEYTSFLEENKDLISQVYDVAGAGDLFDTIKNIDCKTIYEYVSEIEKNFGSTPESIVLCGIGGSSLGVRAFVSNRQSNLKCNFLFLENIDPVSIADVFNKVVLKDTLFIIVSKSGGTIETMLQAEHILNKLAENDLSARRHIIAITGTDKENDLSRLAKDNQIAIYPWHGDIGGRFSALTISTLLPIALAGCDIEKIAIAGKEAMPNTGFEGAVLNYMLWKKNFDVSVIMPYSDDLLYFAAWYRQLWAESIGKDGFGSVPEYSIGTIDQHSMLQMYLGGKKNKLFTIIKINSANLSVLNGVQKTYVSSKYSTLIPNGKVYFSQVLESAADATAKSMFEEGCPVRVITIPEVNEYFIAKMMIHYFYETIFITLLANKHLGYNITPFGQPNVEKSKKNLVNAIKVYD